MDLINISPPDSDRRIICILIRDAESGQPNLKGTGKIEREREREREGISRDDCVDVRSSSLTILTRRREADEDVHNPPTSPPAAFGSGDSAFRSTLTSATYRISARRTRWPQGRRLFIAERKVGKARRCNFGHRTTRFGPTRSRENSLKPVKRRGFLYKNARRLDDTKGEINWQSSSHS